MGDGHAASSVRCSSRSMDGLLWILRLARLDRQIRFARRSLESAFCMLSHGERSIIWFPNASGESIEQRRDLVGLAAGLGNLEGVRRAYSTRAQSRKQS